jgi:serine/threonine protein kinase/peptidoglycan hydrolase-like protein with peptidoglycan-binding domain
VSDADSPSPDVAKPVDDFVALAAGRTIGRYEVVRVLGQGGFGITYRARDGQLGREVAIKEYLPAALAVRQDGVSVLPRSTAAAEDFTWGRERFVAEGRTLANLQDAPGIVRVFDFLEANGTAYIVMQLLHGETLEGRLRRAGPLTPEEIGRVLWPLLDGLEQVHNAGFLHRDIKPANILLDAKGSPTLIDFGAARAAMAGHTTALTAIFTPGYAAAEQMTSAKQGPWTDIYGLSATLYHAITGQRPPSAFDRMLDDACEPLGKTALPGFARGLLAGIDAGLAVRASDRPQNIAGWRPILTRTGALDADSTVAIDRVSPPPPPAPPPTPTLAPAPPPAPVPASPAAAPHKRRLGVWIGAAAVLLLLLAGGGYYALQRNERVSRQAAIDKAAQDAKLAAEAQQLKDEEELAKLRAEAAAREKAEQEAAQRRQIEEETRRKVEAELAAKQREQDEARQKAEAEAAAAHKTAEDDKKAAEATENGLRLTPLDRQHVQAALSALGFDTGGTDGTFGAHTRDQIAAWQKSRNYPPSGYLTGAQNQALLREAAPAVARFDDEQKKKADEEKAKAAAAAAAPAPVPPPQPTSVAAATPSAAAPAAKSGPDGVWRGTLHCTPSRGGGEFTTNFQVAVSGGVGTWFRPGTGTAGMVSISLRISGQQVTVSRVYHPLNHADTTQTATLAARYDGNAITGSGPEYNSGGRTCDISLARAQ